MKTLLVYMFPTITSNYSKSCAGGNAKHFCQLWRTKFSRYIKFSHLDHFFFCKFMLPLFFSANMAAFFNGILNIFHLRAKEKVFGSPAISCVTFMKNIYSIWNSTKMKFIRNSMHITCFSSERYNTITSSVILSNPRPTCISFFCISLKAFQNIFVFGSISTWFTAVFETSAFLRSAFRANRKIFMLCSFFKRAWSTSFCIGKCWNIAINTFTSGIRFSSVFMSMKGFNHA